jgi:GxxExxY protein
MQRDDELERQAKIVVNCCFGLHDDLGPGLLESAYEQLLFELLGRAGLSVERQVPVTLEYRGIVIERAFKADMVVGDKLVLELKSTEKVSPVHAKQLYTYLRLMRLPLGLLINFGLPTFKQGIERVANGYHSGWTRSKTS